MSSPASNDLTDRFQWLNELLEIEPWWQNPLVMVLAAIFVLVVLFVVYHHAVEKPRAQRRHDDGQAQGWSFLNEDDD